MITFEIIRLQNMTLKEEALVFAVKNICLQETDEFTLDKCLKRLNEKGITIPKTTLFRYLTNFNITFDKQDGWEFSQMKDFSYPENELKAFLGNEDKTETKKNELSVNEKLNELTNTNILIFERLERLEKAKNKELKTNQNVNLHNYIEMNSTMKSDLPTVVISFRVSQKLKTMYNEFSIKKNIQHSELLSSLLYSFIQENE